MSKFSDVLDAAADLSADEQEMLIAILRRRLAERNRGQLVRDVAETRAEFADGRAKTASVSEIMDEAGGEA
ncbi:MAG: hypothetical protein L0228_20050 [Planctomycetes bacterium]|nr:hypothetical protein [Planctomycetota bacterium]